MNVDSEIILAAVDERRKGERRAPELPSVSSAMWPLVGVFLAGLAIGFLMHG